MEIWQAFMLGLIQGVAEFLPISSSGHLTLFQMIYDLQEAPLTLAILLHMGTLLAVIAVYWREIWEMIRHPIRSDLKWLILATIPAVAVALTMKSSIEAMFTGQFLGIAFLINSFVLLIAESISRFRENHREDVGWLNALAMGVMQAVAIMPGLSRSGSTIAGGLATGLRRKRAADFAFMMSIPAILGSAAMELKDIADEATAASVSLTEQFTLTIEQMGGVQPVLVGFATAAILGFLAIKFMLYMIRRMSLNWFALYTGILGCIIMVWQLLGNG